MPTTADLPAKILKDWRNQNNMISTALAGVVENYDEYTKDEICEMLGGLASSLDDCSKNLAESIAGLS